MGNLSGQTRKCEWTGWKDSLSSEQTIGTGNTFNRAQWHVQQRRSVQARWGSGEKLNSSFTTD